MCEESRYLVYLQQLIIDNYGLYDRLGWLFLFHNPRLDNDINDGASWGRGIV